MTAEAPTPSAQPAVAIFDPRPLQRVEVQAPGTSTRIIGILRSLLLRAGNAFPRLLASGELSRLVNEAHQVRGSAGSIGAGELAQACAALEQSARRGEPAASAQALGMVLGAIDRLMPVLAARFPPAAT